MLVLTNPITSSRRTGRDSTHSFRRCFEKYTPDKEGSVGDARTLQSNVQNIFFNSVKLKGIQRLRENKAVQLKGVFLISKTSRV